MDAKLSTIYYSPQGYWKDIAAIKTLAAAAKVSKMGQKMADTPSPSANLFSCRKTHCSPQIRCAHAKRSSPGRSSFSSARQGGAWPEPKNIQIRFDRRRCGQPFQRGGTVDLQRIGWGVKRCSENLQTLAFEMARAFASGSWTRIRGCCHQGERKTRIKHSRQAGGYSPRPGHRRKIQPHPCCAPLRAPVCSRNKAVRGPKIFRMGGATSRCGPTLNCEVTQLTGKKPGEAIKECRLFQACDSLRQTCWRAWKVDPLLGGCSLSLPTWWAWGRKGKSHRSDLKVYDIEKTITNPKWTDFALFAERPQAWLCLRGSSCRACRHWAAVSLMASPTAPATTSSPECETLSAPCGCRHPEPSVSRSMRSAPAFFAHRCTSLLCSFSSLCLWRYLRSLRVLRCTGLSAICFVVFASLLMTLPSCLFRPLRNNTCCTRQSC